MCFLPVNSRKKIQENLALGVGNNLMDFEQLQVHLQFLWKYVTLYWTLLSFSWSNNCIDSIHEQFDLQNKEKNFTINSLQI